MQVVIGNEYTITIPYLDPMKVHRNFAPLIRALEQLQQDKKLISFNVISKDLSDIFNGLIQTSDTDNVTENGVTIEINGNQKHIINDKTNENASNTTELSSFGVIRNLLWKRMVHFKRNFRLLICILVLPIVFDVIAMQFMTLRPPNEHDKNLQLSTDLYANSMEFYR